MVAEYAGERCPTAVTNGCAGWCQVRVFDDIDQLTGALRQLGADPERDIGTKLLLPPRSRGGSGSAGGKQTRPKASSASSHAQSRSQSQSRSRSRSQSRSQSRSSPSRTSGSAVMLWFDGDRPGAAATATAASIAALVNADGEKVLLRLSGVAQRHRARLVLTAAKACYVYRRSAKATEATRGDEPEKEKDKERGPTLRFCEVGALALGRELQRLAQAAALAANLENAPSNEVGPPQLARRVTGWFTQGGADGGRIAARTMDADELARQGLGLVLGVGRSGERPPTLTVLELPAANSGSGSGSGSGRRPVVALVGKGVTYDAGGLAIKPLAHMYGMHGDKTGAATAAAVLWHFATPGAPKLPFDLVALLPAVENVVSDRAAHPGDVLTACDGTAVEVVNPDAEGRLILGDALAYAGRLYGSRLVAAVDFATLTMTGSLLAPDLAAAIFTTNAALRDALVDAGERLGERCWPLPSWLDGEAVLRSRVADVRNSGWSTHADGYMASLFLRSFVPASARARWVHIDIADNDAPDGSAYAGGGGSGALKKGDGGHRGGSGYGPFVGTGVALGVAAVNHYRRSLPASGGASGEASGRMIA